MTIIRPRTSDAGERGRTAFAVLSGLTSLALVVQAVVAGQFVSQHGRDGWISVHGVVADVAWVLALASAVVAFAALRPRAGRLVIASGLMFVLTLAQTGIGHLITDEGQDGWIGVHVPLAFVIFALALWLSAQAARLRLHRVERFGRRVRREANAASLRG